MRNLVLWFSIGIGVAWLAGCGKSASEKVRTAIDKSAEAQMLYNDRKYAQAMSVINEAIELNTEMKRDSVLGETYLVKALCLRMLGRYDSAIVAFRASLEYFRLVGDQRLERRGRIELAELLSALRRDHDALSLASDAAAEAKVFGDFENASHAMLLAARVEHKLQDYDKEQTLLMELLTNDNLHVHDIPKPKLFKLLFEASIGTGADEKIQNALQLWKSNAASSGNANDESEVYRAWGEYQVQLRRPDSALASFTRALNLLNGDASRQQQIELLSALGELSYRSRHYDNARLYFSDAQNLAKQENNILQDQLLRLMLVASDMMVSGGTHSSELAQRCKDIAETCRQVHFRAAELIAYFLQGKLAAQSSDSLAVKALKYAIHLDEENNLSEADQPYVQNILDLLFGTDHSGWYEPLIELYCKSGKLNEAFSLIEERNLRDLNAFFWNSTLLTGDGSFDVGLNQLRLKRNTLALLDADILGELATGRSRDVERFESLKEQYPLRLKEYLESLDAVNHANLQWLFRPALVDLHVVQDSLPQGAALVEFMPSTDILYAIVVTKDSSYLRSVNIPRQRLLPIVHEYSALLGDARLNGNAPMFDDAGAISRIGELSPLLYHHLIEPIQPYIEHASKLYIIPPAEFEWLPFHTLKIPGGAPLAVKVPVSYLPSAAVMLFKFEQDRYTQNIVGLGHPGSSGWDVEYELKDIRSFYDKAKLFFDTTATLSHLASSTYELLHIAAPFNLNTQVPDHTTITLSDGQTPFGIDRVPLGNMISIPMPQTLIFSNITSTPGGLSRYLPALFLANGVHTVIATMWQGERKSKKYFGEIFYTNINTGIPTPTAYQMAITAMTKQEESSKLYRWGLYYCFGK